MYQFRLIICIFMFAGSGALQSQGWNEQGFVHLDMRDGLSNNRVTSLLQDQFGYLWISTWKGLNRYDGSNFQQFFADSGLNSLPQDHAHKLSQINFRDIAAITGSGLYLMNTATLQGHNVIIPTGPLKQAYKLNNIMDATGDSHGNLYLLARSGFYHFDNNGKLVFRYDHYKAEEEDTVAFVFGRSLTTLDRNRMLLATSTGMYVYHKDKKQLARVTASNQPLLDDLVNRPGTNRILYADSAVFAMPFASLPQIAFIHKQTYKSSMLKLPWLPNEKFDWRSAIFRINDSTLAISGKTNGFYLIHYNSLAGTYRFDSTLYFRQYYCASIFADQAGRIWIGTNKGLFRQKRNDGLIEAFEVPASMNSTNKDLSIRTILVSNDKVFAASSSEGMLVFDKGSMQPLQKVNLGNDDPLFNHLFFAHHIAADTMLLGAQGGAFWLNTRNLNFGYLPLPGLDKEKDWISCIFKDSRGDVYICRNKNNEYFIRPKGMKTFSLADNILNPLFNILVPRYISEDPQGHVWFSGHGLSRLNYQTRQFDVLLDSFPTLKQARKEALVPTFDKAGRIYFGLPENGLIIYDPRTKRFHQITRNQGLPDNYVRAIRLHGNKVWIGTEQGGMASYDMHTGQVASFGIADGIPAGPFTSYDFCYDSAANLFYAAFNNTIIRFDPDRLTKSTRPPRFFIESIKAGNRLLEHPGETISLRHDENNLVLQLAAINFEDAYQQQFAYRFVKNGNELWQQTGFQRSIIVSNLSPGTHQLQLKVYVTSNAWPEQVRNISIYIHPPFWRTAWFRLLLACISIAVLYYAYRLRIRSVKQKADIDRKLAELEMKGLHAQMNPHFIFNSLNSIKEMILLDEKQNASRYLSKFAQLIRTSLDQSHQAFISVKQCVDHLVQYLEMEQLRFDDFSYSIETEPGLPIEELQMAPMLIQPLVENAIWHGLRNKKGEKKVVIRFYREGRQLICAIEDNGVGLNTTMKNESLLRSPHRSVGISNIRERLAVLNEKYNMRSSLDIRDRNELNAQQQGTIAILKISI